MPAVSRKAVGVVAALAGVAVGVGIGAFLWRGTPPGTPEPATAPAPEEMWSGGILAGTLREVREEKVTLAAGRHQVRALVRMRTERPARLGRAAGWEEFERFKEDQTLSLRAKPFLTAVATHADVARQPLVAQAEDKAAAIDAMLTLRWETPEILAVGLDGNDAAQLNVILTALVDLYLRRTAEAEEKEAAQYRTERDDRLRVIGEKIDKLRAALAKLPGANPADTLERLGIDQQLAHAKLDVRKHQTRRTELETQLKLVKSEEAGEPMVPVEVLEAALAAVPAVVARQREADESLKTLADLKAKFVAGSPKLAEAEGKVREATEAVAAARAAAKSDILRELKAHRQRLLLAERKTTEGQLKIADEQFAAAEKDLRLLERRIAELPPASDGVRPREKDELDALLEQREALVRERVQGELPGDREPRVTLNEPPQTLLDHNVRIRSTLTIATAGRNGSVRDVRVTLKAGARVFVGEKRADLREIANGSSVEANLTLRTSPDGPPEAYELRVIENR